MGDLKNENYSLRLMDDAIDEIHDIQNRWCWWWAKGIKVFASPLIKK